MEVTENNTEAIVTATMRRWAAGWQGLLDMGAPTTDAAAQRAMQALMVVDELEQALVPLKEQARAVLAEIVAEVGEVSTAHGKAILVKGGVRTSWDTKGLTRLMGDVAAARTLLEPYLRTTEIAPTVKITLKKGEAQ